MGSFDDFVARADGRAAPDPEPSPAAPRWVPVRNLAPRDRDAILEHLLGLDERDRYLRFGYPAQDGQITHYVDALDFARDEIFGIFNRRLELVAMVHLAYPRSEAERAPTTAEFGVSVSERLRGRGIGARLFEHAMLHARNRGVDTLVIHALTENRPMLRIAHRAGAVVQRSGGDADASLRLPPNDLASRLEEIVEDGAAEIDFSLKRQAQQVGQLLDSLAEVSKRLIHSGDGSSQ